MDDILKVRQLKMFRANTIDELVCDINKYVLNQNAHVINYHIDGDERRGFSSHVFVEIGMMQAAKEIGSQSLQDKAKHRTQKALDIVEQKQLLEQEAREEKMLQQKIKNINKRKELELREQKQKDAIKRYEDKMKLEEQKNAVRLAELEQKKNA